MPVPAIASFLLLLTCASASAGTMYVQTKDYPWQFGDAPGGIEEGMDLTRAWLERQRPPKLIDPTPAIRRLTIRYFKLEKSTHVKFAVIGPPRSKNGHDPHFFAWIEWVHKSKLPFDKDYRRWVRKAGIGRIAIVGAGEKKLEMVEWRYDKDLDDQDHSDFMPWDAAVIARKMLDFHMARPRNYRDKANGPGQSAPY